MVDKKNIILAFGNKEFNNSLIELKNHFNFNLETINDLDDINIFEHYQGLIIHEEALKEISLKKVIQNKNINKIIFHNSKKIKGFEEIEKLQLPASVDQINNIIVNIIVKKEFKINSSLKINNYKLDKNLRRLVKNDLSLELTEKEIELIELLYKEKFIKKNEILSIIWKYSKDADTHTVETHIYRLRKKIKEVFNDEGFIKNEKKGYTI
tara:strand:+ start:428 stop:1057 length:630 start_codon:yes stop_codon:yes gene_type:complete